MRLKDHQRNVLVVDDEPAVAEVMARSLEQAGYQSRFVLNANAALDELSDNEYDAVLADIKMPEKDGFWLLEQICKYHPDITVLMLTGIEDTTWAIKCLKQGAADYLLKSAPLNEVIADLEKALEIREQSLKNEQDSERTRSEASEDSQHLRHALTDLEQAYYGTLICLTTALDVRESKPHDHSSRVVSFCLLIGERLELSKDELKDVAIGAFLHDIGKLTLDDRILDGKGKPRTEEWDQLKSHPETGFKMLEGVGFLEKAAEIVLSHHESFDGTGYPKGLVGEQIPIGARIFMVAHAVDSTLKRFKCEENSCFEEVAQKIMEESGHRFDPAIADMIMSIPPDVWFEAGSRYELPVDFCKRVVHAVSLS